MDNIKMTFIFLKYALGQIFNGEEIHPTRYLEGESKINLIILPGFFTKRTQYMYGTLADELSNNGYKIYFVPRLRLSVEDIKTCAIIVRDLIDENKLKNIVLFGHSKGGLIGKYYLQHFNENGRVINLIAISSPFTGLSLAKYFILKRFNEFYSQGSFIKELNSNTKDNDKIYSIIPAKDSVIKNIDDMKVEGGKNIFLKTEGHNRAVNSQENISIVLKILDDISKNN